MPGPGRQADGVRVMRSSFSRTADLNRVNVTTNDAVARVPFRVHLFHDVVSRDAAVSFVLRVFLSLLNISRSTSRAGTAFGFFLSLSLSHHSSEFFNLIVVRRCVRLVCQRCDLLQWNTRDRAYCGSRQSTSRRRARLKWPFFGIE